MRTRPIQTLSLFGLLLAAVIGAVSLLAIAREPQSWTDLRILFPIIREWSSGSGSLYPETLEAQRVPGVPSYRYPPVWATAMIPLARGLPLREGIGVWGAISLAVFFGGLVAALRGLGVGLLTPPVAAMALMLALFAPFYETFNGPTKELAMVGLMAATFALAERNRPALAGMAFAAAILHKIYPVLFAPYFLVRRDWGTLIWAGLWLLAFNALPLPWIGVDETIQFYTGILPYQLGSKAYPENAGFELLLMASGWLRWFQSGLGALDPDAFSRGAALAWRVFVVGVCSIVAFGMIRRRRLADRRDRYLLFATWTAAVMAVIPVTWVNYQIWLVLPFSALMTLARDVGPSRARSLAGALACASLLMMSVPLNTWLAERYLMPDAPRPFLLSTSVGEWMHAEFTARVEDRMRSLRAISPPIALGQGPPREIRRWLTDHRIPDASGRGPQLERIQARVAELRAVAGDRSAGGPRLPLEHAEARLRRASLSTAGVVGLLVLRACAGVLAFLAVLLTCASVAAEPSGAAPGAAGPAPRGSAPGAQLPVQGAEAPQLGQGHPR